MELKKEILTYVNVEGLLKELLLKKVIKEAITKAVDRTSTGLDNAVFAALWPTIEKEANEEIDALLAKLIKE